MAHTVPVNVITGFLGAGKTTLLRHVLEHGLAGRRVAVIVNEIGEIGIDGRLIEGLESVDQMVELTSGCICCSPGLQFGLAVQEILDTVRPELLVIETTGTAQVGPLIGEVESLGLRVDAVTCVVDVEHIAYQLKASLAAREQVGAADFLILNKCDLAGAGDCARVSRGLARRNRRAVQYRTEHGRIAIDLLFATAGKTFRERAAGPVSDHLAQDGIESFVYDSEQPFCELGALEETLGQLPREVYRVKGLAVVGPEGRHYLVNVTCGRVRLEVAPVPLARLGRTSLVVIGRRAASHHRPAIERLLARLSGAPATSWPGRLGLNRLRPGGRP